MPQISSREYRNNVLGFAREVQRQNVHEAWDLRFESFTEHVLRVQIPITDTGFHSTIHNPLCTIALNPVDLFKLCQCVDPSMPLKDNRAADISRMNAAPDSWQEAAYEMYAGFFVALSHVVYFGNQVLVDYVKRPVLEVLGFEVGKKGRCHVTKGLQGLKVVGVGFGRTGTVRSMDQISSSRVVSRYSTDRPFSHLRHP